MNINELIDLARQFEQHLPEPVPAFEYNKEPLASFFDHTLLKPDASEAHITQLCEEARQYRFATICVNPIFTSLARPLLAGSGVKVCTVVGFPLGSMPTDIKAFEAQTYCKAGATEIDMVVAVGLVKSERYAAVLDDIWRVADAAHQGGAILKVILEMTLLNRFEKILGCLLCQEAGADFVKTSTGFFSGGATAADVSLMRRVVGPVSRMGVKAAGGIRTLADARTMLDAGANRIGASASVAIMKELSAEKEKHA